MMYLLGFLAGLTAMVAWYGLYLWVYSHLEQIIKPITNAQNGIIITLTPIVAYIMIIIYLIRRFVRWLEKEEF